MKRYAIFAHYDKSAFVDDYVIYYLSELAKVSDFIIFVSDTNLPEEQLKKVKKYTDMTISERHGEYDFGSYKRGFFAIKDKLKKEDELILCNDSCFGPMVSFTKIFSEMEGKKSDMWGIIWDHNKTFLMSFFLVLKSSVFLSKFFEDFLKDVKQEKAKSDIVIKYEKGFSELLNKKGLKLISYFDEHKKPDEKILKKIPYFTIIKHMINKKNLMEVYSDNIIFLRAKGFPFMKKLGLMDKSNCVRGIYPCIVGNYNPKYIKSYQMRNGVYDESLKKIILVSTLRKLMSAARRFIFQKKNNKGKLLIKVFGIPIFNKKVGR